MNEKNTLIFDHIFSHQDNPDIELKLSISDVVTPEGLSLIEVDEVIEVIKASLTYYEDLYDRKLKDVDPDLV